MKKGSGFGEEFGQGDGAFGRDASLGEEEAPERGVDGESSTKGRYLIKRTRQTDQQSCSEDFEGGATYAF